MTNLKLYFSFGLTKFGLNNKTIRTKKKKKRERERERERENAGKRFGEKGREKFRLAMLNDYLLCFISRERGGGGAIGTES